MSKSKSLVVRMADKYGVDGGKLFHTLKNTAFKPRGHNAVEATDAQMMALLIVADQYGLNPFTKEIVAFPGGAGEITPVVSVDGWSRIVNEHPAFDGIEFVYSDQNTQIAGSRSCSEWIEAVIYRKDRSQPTRVREFLDETYQPQRGKFAGPWQTHTKRMLRHKALIQCARVAFGFAGIYDPDEAERIRDMGAADVVNPTAHNNATMTPEADVIEAQIVYEEISQAQKDGMSELLNKVIARAASAGAWAAAREYVEGRFKEGELQYALEYINEAEESHNSEQAEPVGGEVVEAEAEAVEANAETDAAS